MASAVGLNSHDIADPRVTVAAYMQQMEDTAAPWPRREATVRDLWSLYAAYCTMQPPSIRDTRASILARLRTALRLRDEAYRQALVPALGRFAAQGPPFSDRKTRDALLSLVDELTTFKPVGTNALFEVEDPRAYPLIIVHQDVLEQHRLMPEVVAEALRPVAVLGPAAAGSEGSAAAAMPLAAQHYLLGIVQMEGRGPETRPALLGLLRHRCCAEAMKAALRSGDIDCLTMSCMVLKRSLGGSGNVLESGLESGSEDEDEGEPDEADDSRAGGTRAGRILIDEFIGGLGCGEALGFAMSTIAQRWADSAPGSKARETASKLRLVLLDSLKLMCLEGAAARAHPVTVRWPEEPVGAHKALVAAGNTRYMGPQAQAWHAIEALRAAAEAGAAESH